MTNAQIAERKNFYRRIRNLSDYEFSQVIQLVDSFEEREPNEETIAAFEEADRIAKDPNAKTYSSAKELFDELRAECIN